MEQDNRTAVVENFNMSTESLEELRSFVTLLMEKILTKCRVLEDQSQEDRVTYIKHLVNLTMEGLRDTEGVSPDLSMKDINKICKAVVSELKKKFCDGQQLETQIFPHDPDFDAVIVQSVQTHIKAQFAKKDHTCRIMLTFVVFIAAFGVSIYKLLKVSK